MKRLLPFPLLSLMLWCAWLLLNGVSWGHALLGLALALLLPLASRRFWPNAPRIHHLPKLCRFVLMVHWDIIVANVEVARLILGPSRRLRPAFVELPLDLVDDCAIALLASTVSLTPGTVSADISEDRRTLLIHTLHMDDQAELIAHIKQRYERPLKEIFRC